MEEQVFKKVYFVGNIVSIRVTSVDDHIVDQIDFSKANLEPDKSETADQSCDLGFKSADHRNSVKMAPKVSYKFCLHEKQDLF